MTASLPSLKELVVHTNYYSRENIFDLDKTLVDTNRHGMRCIRKEWTANFEIGIGIGTNPHLQNYFQWFANYKV